MRDTVSEMREQKGEEVIYDPGHLLDALIERLQLKNDSALAVALSVGAPAISKIRCQRIPISGLLLIRMHEISGLTIGDLRYLMGDRRQRFRLSSAQGRPAM